MERSKGYAMMFLLGAFVAGAFAVVTNIVSVVVIVLLLIALAVTRRRRQKLAA